VTRLADARHHRRLPAPPPDELQSELERRHPGRTRFKNNGMLLVLKKRG
jgi:hypothetical protein